VTDDAFLIAKAAVGAAEVPPHRPAEAVKGIVLTDACRAHEFRITSVDALLERVHIEAEVIHTVSFREFIGFNRA
jgi:hypothetical protein